ncbi:DNA repair protein RadC [Burkholderia pseudomallei]|nr:DNA repair protein RadC [Burkholderia pseudomallei]CAJ5625826.1 DNA repair protein RadC [Burkholderia pseudomallei]CAK0494826.1 DNA repair protein RadC [Burkholderia pseudomallei]
MLAFPTLADRPFLTSSTLTQSEQQLVQDAKAVLERRLFQRGPALTTPQDVIDYLRLTMTREDREVFTVVFLDTHHRVIAVEPLFFGTVDGAHISARVILHRAILLNSTAIIVAHNHPSGEMQPSAADQRLTAELAALRRLVDMRLLDHFVIGQGEPFFLCPSGLALTHQAPLTGRPLSAISQCAVFPRTVHYLISGNAPSKRSSTFRLYRHIVRQTRTDTLCEIVESINTTFKQSNSTRTRKQLEVHTVIYPVIPNFRHATQINSLNLNCPVINEILTYNNSVFSKVKPAEEEQQGSQNRRKIK